MQSAISDFGIGRIKIGKFQLGGSKVSPISPNSPSYAVAASAKLTPIIFGATKLTKNTTRVNPNK